MRVVYDVVMSRVAYSWNMDLLRLFEAPRRGNQRNIWYRDHLVFAPEGALDILFLPSMGDDSCCSYGSALPVCDFDMAHREIVRSVIAILVADPRYGEVSGYHDIARHPGTP